MQETKEKQAAEEALRSSNLALSLRVRALEEQAEKHDGEHVIVSLHPLPPIPHSTTHPPNIQLASDLVRTKVDNQRLLDDNESLRLQVAELQAIVAAQPGEVEGRLRQEMERIMQRNIEVQNENRHLEEQCSEMEGELVQTKLKHAEVSLSARAFRGVRGWKAVRWTDVWGGQISTELEAMRQTWNNVQQLMNKT